MKTNLIIFFLITFLNVFAQNDKPRYYYDENESQISEDLYIEKAILNLGKYKYIALDFEIDTCYISLIIRRKNYGRLKQVEFDSLQKSLTDSIYVPKNKITIIQYHPGADECNSGSSRVMPDKKYMIKQPYLKKLNKDVGVNHYWIHKDDKNVKYRKSRLVPWQKDKNQIVESLFFRYHFPCHSFAIIDNSTKKYVTYYGEYHSSRIIDFLKEIIKSNEE